MSKTIFPFGSSLKTIHAQDARHSSIAPPARSRRCEMSRDDSICIVSVIAGNLEHPKNIRFDGFTEPPCPQAADEPSLPQIAFQNGWFSDVSHAPRVPGTLSRLSAVSRRLARGGGDDRSIELESAARVGRFHLRRLTQAANCRRIATLRALRQCWAFADSILDGTGDDRATGGVYAETAVPCFRPRGQQVDLVASLVEQRLLQGVTSRAVVIEVGNVARFLTGHFPFRNHAGSPPWRLHWRTPA